ncbi:MAG TPA: tetratricopeptide repeat protein, partial [bacterium]|nr:tetratricopeptide repeat protein [bacterium]
MRDNYAAEIKALTQHLGTHKESMAFARLADRYLQLNEVEKALDICQNGLRNHPHYDSAHFVLAKCFLALNQLEEAEKHLKHLLSRNPQFLNAHRLYASLMARMGMTSRERTSLLQLRELDPFFAGIAAEAGLEAPAAEVATPPETWPVPPAPKPESWPAPPASAPAPAAAAPSGGLSPTPPPAPQEPFATAPAAMAPAAAPAVVPPAAAAPAAEPSPWDRAPVPPPPAFSPSTPPQPFAPESKFAEPEPQPRPVSEYRPPVPEMDLDAFARELAALEVPASDEASETPAGPVGEIQPLAEAAIEIREPENDFEREETQFSEILDDLFSLSRDEEDRREQEARHTIERAARQPEPDLG